MFKTKRITNIMQNKGKNVHNILDYVVDKRRKTNIFNEHHQRIFKLFHEVIEEQLNYVPVDKDELLIKFESEHQLQKFLYSMPVMELLKFKYNNEDNLIIRKFCKSLDF